MRNKFCAKKISEIKSFEHFFPFLKKITVNTFNITAAVSTEVSFSTTTISVSVMLIFNSNVFASCFEIRKKIRYFIKEKMHFSISFRKYMEYWESD